MGATQGSLQALLRYMRPYRKRFIKINALYFANSLLNLIPAATVGAFINIVISKEETNLFGLTLQPEWFHERLATWQMIAGYALGMLALILVANLIGVIMWRKMTAAVQQVLLDLKMDIRAHLNKLSLGYFQREQTGTIMEKALGDVQRLEMLFKTWFFLLYGLLQFLMAPFFMLAQSWQLFLAVLVPTPLIVASVWLIQSRLKPLYRELREKESSAASMIQETVSGIREIKAYTMEETSNRRYQDVSRRVYDQNLDIMRVFSVSHQMQYSTQDIALTLIAVSGALLIFSGTGDVTAGTITSFIALTAYFFNPIRQFVGFFETFQRGIVSWDRIRNFLAEDAKEAGHEEGIHLIKDDVRGQVRFENVAFGYASDREILRGVSLEARPGEKVGIVGVTGGGKSTLMSLLLRFYEPTEGRITLDGRDIREINRRSLRANCGIVFQDTFLFFGTIRENLLFANPGRSMREIEAACEAAGILERIKEFPQGFDTMVGERGQKLSGGEKQRFSIARLLLKDPRIVILDEATSALDAATELHVQASFERLLRGRTAFVIAHRLATVQKCDTVIVMANGGIAEAGSHEDLVARRGRYAELWHGQTSGIDMKD